MAVAIDTSVLARHMIPQIQAGLDHLTGGRRRLQIHRASLHATIPFPDSELWRQSSSALHKPWRLDVSLAKQEALNWQADPDDDLGDAAVLHHLHQQAATIPLLISQSDHGNARTTLTGSVSSASITVLTQGRLLSSFHRYSMRGSKLGHQKSTRYFSVIGKSSFRAACLPSDVCEPSSDAWTTVLHYSDRKIFDTIVWAGTPRDNLIVFWQLQIDAVDLFSRRTPPTSHAGKRPRTAFNQFLQVSDSPVVEDTVSRGNLLPHARRYNGVRFRPDRRTWVAEMKPPKHKTKQDFGNFKSEAEAARAVDAAFHHYGRSDLLNFPDTSLQFLSRRPTALPGLDERAKVKFVREEAKLLLASIAATSPPHSTHTNSLQILELSASSPLGGFRPLPDSSSLFSSSCCVRSDDADVAICQPQPWVDIDSICDISTTEVRTNLETVNSIQNAEQGWDCAEDSSTLAAPPNVENFIAYKNQSMWLDPLIWSPPALTFSRSPSPSHAQEGIANALLEQQNI